MSDAIVLDQSQISIGRDTITGLFEAAVNAVIGVALSGSLTNHLALPMPDVDLESEFSGWASDSLEWAQATFDAQAETWPTH
jgi:hypothetical protein